MIPAHLPALILFVAIYEHTVGDALKVVPQIFSVCVIYSKFTVATGAVSVCYVNSVLGFKIKAKQSTSVLSFIRFGGKLYVKILVLGYRWVDYMFKQ